MTGKRKRPEHCPNCGGTDLVDTVDNEGKPYRGCPRCVIGAPKASPPFVPTDPHGPPFVSVDGRLPDEMPRFSLRKLRDTQWRLEQIWRAEREGPAFVHPFTGEQLAILSYAIAVLAAERLAAGERLTEADDETSRAEAASWPKASTGHEAARWERDDADELADLAKLRINRTRMSESERLVSRADRLAREAALLADDIRQRAEAELAGDVERLVAQVASYHGDAGDAARADTVRDPEGDDPVSLWREWCSRDWSEADDRWAAFTDRVHAMLDRHGVKT